MPLSRGMLLCPVHSSPPAPLTRTQQAHSHSFHDPDARDSCSSRSSAVCVSPTQALELSYDAPFVAQDSQRASSVSVRRPGAAFPLPWRTGLGFLSRCETDGWDSLLGGLGGRAALSDPPGRPRMPLTRREACGPAWRGRGGKPNPSVHQYACVCK